MATQKLIFELYFEMKNIFAQNSILQFFMRFGLILQNNKLSYFKHAQIR